MIWPSGLTGAVRQAGRVPVARRPQEERRGVHGAAGDHDHVRRVPFLRAVARDMDRRDPPSGGVRVQPRHQRLGQQGDVRMPESGQDARGGRVVLAVDETRKPIEGLALDAGAEVPVGLVEADAHRQGKGMEPLPLEVIVDLPHPRFVGHGRERVRSVARRLGRIAAPRSVHAVQPLRLEVIGGEVLIAARPGRREAVVVPDLPEVAFPHPQQHGAVDLRVAADVIVRAGAERAALLVVPSLRGVVALFDEDRVRVPVGLLPRKPSAALEQQDPLSGRREPVRQRGAAGARADDRDVITIARRHSRRLPQEVPQITAAGAMIAAVEPRVLWWVRTNMNSEIRSAASASVARFSMMKRPWTTLSVCGTRNGRSGSSPGTGPKLQVSAPVIATRRSTSHSATAMPAPGSPAAKRPGSSSHSAPQPVWNRTTSPGPTAVSWARRAPSTSSTVMTSPASSLGTPRRRATSTTTPRAITGGTVSIPSFRVPHSSTMSAARHPL